MNVHLLQDAPAPELALALERFEAQFRYPLGPGRTFTISHGADYSRFFRSMGEGVTIVVERGGEVLGTLGIAIRQWRDPEGVRRRAAYLGDLKVAPGARRSRVLLSLLREGRTWAAARADCGYSVVMDGTEVTPATYGGRLGIPAFHPVGKVGVIRLSAVDGDDESARVVDSPSGLACFRRFEADAWTSVDGRAEDRSAMEPRWIALADGAACGRVEDTMRAKRLFADNGEEMRSAHLSCFAFGDPEAGARLARAALRHAGDLGFPAMFLATPEHQTAEFLRAFGGKPLAVAGATIYAAGLPASGFWRINTAEI